MERSPRARLDHLLVTRGLAPTRAKAQALVLAGRVTVDGRPAGKAGVLVPEDSRIEIAAGPSYVSRAGPKLAGAIRAFGIDPRGLDALDVGASTGGFTDALLEAGARHVVALDVGRGQLDWRLRNDPRVTVLDGVNARYLEPATLPFRPSLAVVDVSFISLERVLPPVVSCLDPGGELLSLVKPQFEVGRGKVGPGGIVRDPALHRAVLSRLCSFVSERGWTLRGIVRSSVVGARGNVEFFLHVSPASTGPPHLDLEDAIARALSGGPTT
jgi:23S rRNA (cytidine1920-2'-O)/16S rRNA (cytidine1409-2'-O)-methyltransferase